MNLGPPIRKPPEPKPEWFPVPDKPHLEQNSKGQLRTAIPENELASYPAWAWKHIYTRGEAGEWVDVV